MLKHPRSHTNQTGAALIVSLLILLVMTLLGLSSINSTRLEEKMAGNTRDMNLSLQAAESALRIAEDYINTTVLPPFDGSTVGLYAKSTTGKNLYEDPAWDWDVDAIAYDATVVNGSTPASIPGISSQPRYYIEEVSSTNTAGSSLVIGLAPKNNKTTYYRITAGGLGASPNSLTILQSMFKR